VSLEHVERCTDPHVLNYTSWQTLPGINVLLVDEYGVVEDSAGDSLRGSPKHWLIVPANHQPFSVRLQLNGPCPLWEVVSFKLKVQGVHSFFVKVGDQASDNVQVLCIGATTVGTGPPNRPTMYCPPNFLAVVFKKQEILQQVVTGMQDLASEFSKKIFRGDTQDPHSGRGRPPPAPNTQPGLWQCAGRKRPGDGTQTLVPLNFSAVVALRVLCITKEPLLVFVVFRC